MDLPPYMSSSTSPAADAAWHRACKGHQNCREIYGRLILAFASRHTQQTAASQTLLVRMRRVLEVVYL